MKPQITVFTPTYNRAYTIHKCYESLQRQTNSNFIWLVIDDGSTDNTKELINKWINNSKFEIRYIYKRNGGMHTAHNIAYENIDTELNVCIDSDDYMTDNAIEIIITNWNKVKDNKIAGLGALNIFENKEVIGQKFPSDLKVSKYFDLYNKYRIKGDKKFIYRSDLTRKYPYPEFEDEKYVGLDYKYKKLDDEYKIALINEPVCVVEYMEDGSSRNMLRQYKNNPKGWCFYRVENLKIDGTSIKYKVRESIHYVSSSLMIKDRKFLIKTPYKLLTVLAYPLGYLLKSYILYKVKD